MGFRFRRSIRIMRGVRLNVGKRGVSTSIGVRGAHVTIGKTGVRRTVGIPGTGLSWTSLRRTSPPQIAPVAAEPGCAPAGRSVGAGWGRTAVFVLAVLIMIFMVTR